MFEEIQDSAEKLSIRAARLQLACLEKNKENVIWYVKEIAFWSNAVLSDYFDLESELTKGAENA